MLCGRPGSSYSLSWSSSGSAKNSASHYLEVGQRLVCVATVLMNSQQIPLRQPEHQATTMQKLIQKRYLPAIKTCKKLPPYLGGFFAVFLFRRSCSCARVRHASSIRLKASFVSSSSARSARKAQSSALSRKISAELIRPTWAAQDQFQPDYSVKCL